MLRVQIKSFDREGFGIAYFQGRKIRVVNGLIGEEVEVERLVNNLYYVKEIIEQSPYRTKAICPVFGLCGACRWQHIRYDNQLSLKESIIEQLYGDIAEKIMPIDPSPNEFGYRNKAEFIFSKDGNKLVIGYREFGSYWKVVDIDYCYLISRKANSILKKIKEYVKKKRIEPYDIRKHKGFLRYLVIREGVNTGKLMVILITTSNGNLNLVELYDKLKDPTPSSLIWAISDSRSDVAYGEIKDNIGEAYLTERLNKYIFKITPFSFFQVNTKVAEKMFNFVRNLTSGEIALDLYSGVGSISIHIADRFDKVVGIEMDKKAVYMAKINSQLNDIRNTKFVLGRVEDLLKKIEYSKVDTVILDPPRAGTNPKVIRYIIRKEPKEIVYFSCNVYKTKRDVEAFLERNYRLELIKPFDQFPQTPHIEAIFYLVKK